VAALPQKFRTWHPRLNIVLDFPGAESALDDATREIDVRGVRRVRASEAASGLRLWIDLDEPLVEEALTLHGRFVWLTLSPANVDRPARGTWDASGRP